MPKYYAIQRSPEHEAVARVPVLHIPGSPVVAVAHTNSPNARIWDILNMDTHKALCQVRGVDEAHTALIAQARARDIQPTETYQE